MKIKKESNDVRSKETVIQYEQFFAIYICHVKRSTCRKTSGTESKYNKKLKKMKKKLEY